MISRDGGRSGYWGWIVAGHSGSGLSIEAYCQRCGVSNASFYLWRKRLGMSGAALKPKAGGRPMGLVPVRVIPGLPSPALGFRGGITVELPNGIRLRTRDVSMAVAAIQLLGREVTP
jgi:hypothetical protein